ncbi:MAG: M48 family metallopeptidase [Nitrospinae bacterium]|nr:M48 family metallopeptidase [Nitrospinota bacterium]
MEIDKIVRSRRRTFALIVGRDATLTVRAPHRASEAEIRALVRIKSAWILRKQEDARKTFTEFAPKKFTEGETFLYLGKKYELFVGENSAVPLELGEKFVLSKKYVGREAGVFLKWYRRRALEHISERVKTHSASAGLRPGMVKVNGALKRWGSCAAAGNLNFAWRLVMAPPEVVDYVVLHELSHLVHKNHSKRFWENVRALQPDYKANKKWLKDHGHLLSL